MALVGALLLLTTTACTPPGDDPGASGAEASPTFATQGSPVSVQVSPGEAFRLEVPGVATITGGAGSVESRGAVTALAATGETSDSAGVTVAGTGVDVAILGTELVKPLTVTFEDYTGDDAQGRVPAVLHQSDDGSIDVRPATPDSNGNLVVTTADFSINLPALVDVKAWLAERIDSIADGITGRTDAPPCKDNGPAWASLDSPSDLVHDCLITNTSDNGAVRAEAQFAGNRRTYLFVDIPPGASYAWVADMPDFVRDALADFWGYDRDRGAIIRGGKSMTAGYTQPSASVDKTFYFSINRATATMSTIAPLLEVFNLNPEQATAVALLLAVQCHDKIPGSIESASDAWELVPCIVGDGLEALRDPDKAFATAMDLYGDAAYARSTEKALSSTISQLRFFGQAIKTVSLAFSVRDIWVQAMDAATQAFAPASQQATLSLSAAKANEPPVPTSSELVDQPTSDEPDARDTPEPPAPVSLGISGDCTTAGGTLSGTGTGFTPGGQATYRAWYPDGSEYPGLNDTTKVRADGTVPWIWPCAGDGAGTYTTSITDDSTGRQTPTVAFTIAEAPPVDEPTEQAPPPGTWTEQSGSLGSPTFRVVTNAAGPGPRIGAMAYVEVTCKVKPATTIDSAMPDGYWYRIASAPWNNEYYAVANTFWNGDIPGQKPYTHNVDWNVPDC